MKCCVMNGKRLFNWLEGRVTSRGVFLTRAVLAVKGRLMLVSFSLNTCGQKLLHSVRVDLANINFHSSLKILIITQYSFVCRLARHKHKKIALPRQQYHRQIVNVYF